MRKTGRMNKIILTALIFLTFGCKNEHTVSLENDPIINEYFNINETQDLSKILQASFQVLNS